MRGRPARWPGPGRHVPEDLGATDHRVAGVPAGRPADGHLRRGGDVGHELLLRRDRRAREPRAGHQRPRRRPGRRRAPVTVHRARNRVEHAVQPLHDARQRGEPVRPLPHRLCRLARRELFRFRRLHPRLQRWRDQRWWRWWRLRLAADAAPRLSTGHRPAERHNARAGAARIHSRPGPPRLHPQLRSGPPLRGLLLSDPDWGARRLRLSQIARPAPPPRARAVPRPGGVGLDVESLLLAARHPPRRVPRHRAQGPSGRCAFPRRSEPVVLRTGRRLDRAAQSSPRHRAGDRDRRQGAHPATRAKRAFVTSFS